MARFVLDIANLSEQETEDIMLRILNDEVISKTVVTISCIDTTNDNQFHEDGADNVFSERQIEKFRELMSD